MDLWLKIVGAILLYGVYRYWARVNRFKMIDKMFPGLPTVPFLGNALELFGDTHDIHQFIIKYGRLFRRSFCVWIGPFPFIILQTPNDIEAVLNNTVHIKKAMVYDLLIPWVQRGLLTSDGDKWKKNRKLLTPAFHFKILDGFLEIFHRNCTTMCDILESKVGLDGFNAFEVVKMCALDNISETAMGVTIDAQRNPSSDYAQAIKTMCYIVFLRSMRPWMRPDIIFNHTKWGEKQRRSLKILQGYTSDIIDKRVEKRKEKSGSLVDKSDQSDFGIKNKTAFLDLLLDYYDEGLLTREEIQEEVDTFMFEGHDTITSAISFAFYYIANSAKIQEQAFIEQMKIFGEDSRLAGVDDLHEMKYLEMVIKESLRLSPSVPAFGRQIESDVKLDDYTTIPAGVEAIVVTPCIHRNPDVWENPEEFDPERFTTENIAKRHPYSFIPFSAGPRNCIGMRFAMMEMKATLSHVLRRFILEPAKGAPKLELSMEVVLQSRNGAPISLRRR